MLSTTPKLETRSTARLTATHHRYIHGHWTDLVAMSAMSSLPLLQALTAWPVRQKSISISVPIRQRRAEVWQTKSMLSSLVSCHVPYSHISFMNEGLLPYSQLCQNEYMLTLSQTIGILLICFSFLDPLNLVSYLENSYIMRSRFSASNCSTGTILLSTV
jgi:hypothetical protein